MKPRRRVWSAIKWSGAIVTALLAIVGVASGWHRFGVGLWTTFALSASDGQLQIYYVESWSIQPPVWQWWHGEVGPTRPNYCWWFSHEDNCGWNASFTVIGIPFWVLAVTAGAPTLLMFRADRRRRRREATNHCVACGYSRTGLPADRPCPECGTSVTAAS